ncbi:MAG: hypothetical protein EOO56_24135 [Hymenobacter sp.]|nr:MAG: hypothetical protein EOO56_24135 [Hymenobacter sp.]
MSLPDTLILADDSQRLQALAPYLLLGSAPDTVFDEVVRLTAKLCGHQRVASKIELTLRLGGRQQACRQ